MVVARDELLELRGEARGFADLCGIAVDESIIFVQLGGGGMKFRDLEREREEK